MKRIPTNLALGDIDGMPVILTEYTVNRPPLKNERSSDDSGFIQFANASNLPELLIAIDTLLEKFGMTDLILDLSAPYVKTPQPIDPNQAMSICNFFDQPKPTRTYLEKTREALEVWNIDKAKPKDMFPPSVEFHPMNLFTPLEDIIAASADLRQTARMMAWLVGKMDFKSVHSLDSSMRTAKLRTLESSSPQFLHKYYESLKANTGNLWAGLNLNMRVEQIHLYDEATIEDIVRAYVESAFTLLMSDERKILASTTLIPYTCFHTVLSAAWSYFADGLNKDEGPGSIGVCKHCHNFFEQQRSTRQYCSDSCRVMAQRAQDKHKASSYEYYITKTMLNRESARERNSVY